MTQTESLTDRMKSSSSSRPIPSELAAMGQKRIEEFADWQAELLKTLQETNRRWLDRTQSEASLASTLASKMTAARSLPEVMAAYQDWTSRRFEMMAEDGKQLLADAQRFMETSARFMSNGWPAKGRGGTT
jgi:hypothetical protein